MAIAVGQTSKGGAGTGLLGASTAAVNTSASGSTFVVGLTYFFSNTFSSISDTINGSASGNTWTQIGSEATTFSTTRNRLYYCSNANGGTNHVFSFTSTGSANFAQIFMIEITGAATASFDTSAGPLDDASSPFSSGATATTAQANEMLVGFMCGGNTGSNPATHAASGATPSGGWTIQTGAEETDGATNVCGGFATQVVSATGAYTWSFTESGSTEAAAAIATFKEAAAGGGGGISIYYVGA